MWKCWRSLLHTIINIQFSSVHIPKTFRSLSSHLPTIAFCWGSKSHIRHIKKCFWDHLPDLSFWTNKPSLLTLNWIPKFKFLRLPSIPLKVQELSYFLSYAVCPLASVATSASSVHLSYCPKDTFMFSSFCFLFECMAFQMCTLGYFSA